MENWGIVFLLGRWMTSDEEVEEVNETAYVMTEEEFQKPITTPEQKDRLLEIIDNYVWIRHGDKYGHVEKY